MSGFSRKTKAVKLATGQVVEAELFIGRAAKRSDGAWECDVAIIPIEQPGPIVGIDENHAFHLAKIFMRLRLAALSLDWDFLDADGRNIDLDDFDLS